MNKSIVSCFALLSLALSVKAQSNKLTGSVNQVWLAYTNQTRLSSKFGLWTDLHLRTKENFVDNFSQSVIRFGLTYYLTDVTKLTAGYAYLSNYSSDAPNKTTQPEHRPWQQVQWHTDYGKKRMMQWVRLEERFRRKILNDATLATSNNFNFRIRYNILFDLPLSKKGIVTNTVSLVMSDEVHFNFGKQIINHYFDQNRFFAGLKYKVSEHNNVQLGYMNLIQQLSAGKQYRGIHAIRLFYIQNLDFRKEVSLRK